MSAWEHQNLALDLCPIKQHTKKLNWKQYFVFCSFPFCFGKSLIKHCKRADKYQWRLIRIKRQQKLAAMVSGICAVLIGLTMCVTWPALVKKKKCNMNSLQDIHLPMLLNNGWTCFQTQQRLCLLHTRKALWKPFQLFCSLMRHFASLKATTTHKHKNSKSPITYRQRYDSSSEIQGACGRRGKEDRSHKSAFSGQRAAETPTWQFNV